MTRIFLAVQGGGIAMNDRSAGNIDCTALKEVVAHRKEPLSQLWVRLLPPPWSIEVRHALELGLYALGILEPSFDELVLTRYPSPRAYLRTLGRPEVRAASSARAQGLDLHWIYTADESEGALGE